MSAARALGLPPGVVFKPEADDLVKLYLLPRASGQPAVITGVIIEDEGTGAAVPPWELLARHGRTEDNETYFFERIGGGNVKNRGCGGGWTWVSQRRTPDKVFRLPSGEEISWNRRDLNLHPGRGRSGSTGWVMHEYTITSPSCPSPVKLCHIAFTGHGQKRQRESHDVDAQQPRQHKRAAAASSLSEAPKTTTFLEQQPVLLPLGQDQERQQPVDFNQDQLQSYEGSSVPTSWGSGLGSSQETCPGQQDLACSQQQPQEHLYDYKAYGALLASDIGAASQEPPSGAGQPLITQVEQFGQQLNHFLGMPTNAETVNNEGHIPPKEEPLMDQGSPAPWDNIDAFCDVSQLQPEDYYNNDIATGDGGIAFIDWDGVGTCEEQGAM